MSEKLLVVLSLIWLGLFVAACVKGKIRWGGFLALVSASIQSLVVSLLLLFANPLWESGLGIGLQVPSSYLVPAAVGAMILILAILTPVIGKRLNPAPNAQPSKLRWVGFVGALLIVQVGMGLSLSALYSAPVYGLSHASPPLAVTLYTILSIPGCALLYIVSRLGSPARPNLMRWLSFITLNGWFIYPLTLSLIFIFGLPQGTSREALNFSALVMLANVAPALVVVGLARDYATKTLGEHSTL